jgi:hypothetical protein
MFCQVVTELEGADMEDSRCNGQCGGKGVEDVMLKMGRE